MVSDAPGVESVLPESVRGNGAALSALLAADSRLRKGDWVVQDHIAVHPALRAGLEGLLDQELDVLIRVTPGIKAETHSYIQTGQLDSKFGLGLADEQAGVCARSDVSLEVRQRARLAGMDRREEAAVQMHHYLAASRQQLLDVLEGPAPDTGTVTAPGTASRAGR